MVYLKFPLELPKHLKHLFPWLYGLIGCCSQQNMLVTKDVEQKVALSGVVPHDLYPLSRTR